MREIEHHLDAIQAGIEGVIEDYERQPTPAFFEPKPPKSKRPGPQGRHQKHHPHLSRRDTEIGAEVTALAGEINLGTHPNGEIALNPDTSSLIEQLGDTDPHLVAVGIEIARLVTELVDSED